VVHVESVAWAQPLADAGQRSVEAIAEPVDYQCGDHDDQRAAVPTRRPVAQTGGDHGQETEQGEVVGIDPGGHAFGQPDQGLLFRRCQHAELLAFRFLEPRGL
jgi:hypothetical protein